LQAFEDDQTVGLRSV